MTDGMGYNNIDRVYDILAADGRLCKPNGDTLTLDTLALSMMTYMARMAMDKENAKGNEAYWCYWGGWDNMAARMGMILPDEELRREALERSEEYADVVRSRTLTARNRLSRTAKALQKNGCIKLLRPAITFAQKNAIWLLLLGESDEENAEAERVARRAFGLPEA